VTGNWERWELNARQYNEIFGPALNHHRVANGLPPVDNVRDWLHGDHPWLAADPVLAPWPQPAGTGPAELGAAHAAQAPTTESLTVALGTALDPGTRARAKAVAATIRADGTTVAAELLFSATTA
jgi:vancomycin aglycone glucosyltransferase